MYRAVSPGVEMASPGTKPVGGWPSMLEYSGGSAESVRARMRGAVEETEIEEMEEEPDRE